MSPGVCEACGQPLDSEHPSLCDRCAATIDRDTDAMLEREHDWQGDDWPQDE
jgi:predicted amidophosphoribosyltransferase